MSPDPPQWLPIRYREFYDFPRIFVVSIAGEILVFDAPFNEAIDDYEPEYSVYAVSSEPPASGSWEHATENGVLRGRIPASSVRFDDTRRRYVDASSIASIAQLATGGPGRR